MKAPALPDATWAIAESIASDGPITLDEAAQISAGLTFSGWCSATPATRSYHRARARRILLAGVEAEAIVRVGDTWRVAKTA